MSPGSFFRSGSSFGDGTNHPFAFGDSLRDIEGAETGPVFLKIRIAVITGADNIQVIRLVTFSQSAGTGPVAVPSFIGQ
jgi:hypothetical protein